jgi:hypothetical protein
VEDGRINRTNNLPVKVSFTMSRYEDANAKEKQFRQPISQQAQVKDDRMRGRTPNMSDFFIFNCISPVRHLSSWNCMHSI